jgi:DNA-binding response OmpR family regulator
VGLKLATSLAVGGKGIAVYNMIDSNPGTILVVDDDVPITMFLEELLSDEGYTVHVAHYGRDVLEQIVEQSPDVVLLDVNLPDMSGYDVCRRLAASRQPADLPILLMSGVDRGGDGMAHELNVGDFDFIGKPFHNDELLARLRVLVRLRRLQQRLVEQDHLQAVAETAGAMTHELGPHLTAASKLVQRMLAEANVSPKQLILQRHLVIARGILMHTHVN